MSKVGLFGPSRKQLLWASLTLAGLAIVAGAPIQAGPSDLPPDLQAKRLGGYAAGLKWLMDTQQPDGSWQTPAGDAHHVGYTALPAYTLLQSGVPARNPVIRSAVDYVEAAIPKMDNTYEIGLSIMLLDRFIFYEEIGGIKTERSVVARRYLQGLALRLIAGQTLTGGWGYSCKVLTDAEAAQLLRDLRHKHIRYTRLPVDKGGYAVLHNLKYLMEKPKPKKRGKKIIPSAPPQEDATSDNSCTQTALLAVFTAGRYGIPVKRCFRLLTKRYRSSQNSDGGWGYKYRLGGGEPASPAMMAAGLLGLALEYGLQDDDAPLQLKATHAGVASLAAALAEPVWSSVLPAIADVGRAQDVKSAGHRRADDSDINRGLEKLGAFVGMPAGRAENLPQPNLYFLWSLQRMGALYDLPTIAGKDWYRWGTEALLANQNVAGNWQNGGYPASSPVIDTCFALLFLKQRDLSRTVSDKLDDDATALTKLAKVTHPVAEAGKPTPPKAAMKATPVVAAPKTPTPSAPPPASSRKTASTPRSPVVAETPPPAPSAEPTDSSNKTLLLITAGGGAGILLIAGAVFIIMSRSSAPASPKRKAAAKGSKSGARPRPGKTANGTAAASKSKLRKRPTTREDDD